MKILKFILKIFGVLFVLYGIIGIFILPNIVKDQIEEKASTALKREVTLNSISINPYAFKVSLYDFVINSTKDKENFVNIKEIILNVDPLEMIIGEIHISLVEIVAPSILVHKFKDGNFNFSDFLVATNEETTEPEEKIELPKILLDKFAIKRGTVHFVDDSGNKSFSATLKPINFALRDLSTQSNHKNEVSLHIDVDDGAFIEYRGKLNSLDPLRLEGSLQLHSGRLYTQWKYIQDSLGVIVADGAMDASFSYKADLSTTPMKLDINQYQVSLTDLRLQDKQTKENVLKLPILKLNGSADITNKKVVVNNFEIKDFFAKAVRDKEGHINWMTYFGISKEAAPEDTNTSSESSPWKVNIVHVGIGTQGLSFEEHYAAQPFIVGFNKFDLNLENIQIDSNKIYLPEYVLNIKDVYLDEISNKKTKAMLIPNIRLNGNAFIKKQEINLENISIDGVQVIALKDKKGLLNFSKYAPIEREEIVKKEIKEATPWIINLDDFNLNTDKISYLDYSAQEPFHADIQKINVNVKGLKLDGADINITKIKTKLSSISLVTNTSKTTLVKLSSFNLDAQMQKSESIDININDISLNRLDIYALMDENGVINFTKLSPKNPPKTKSKKQKVEKSTKLNWNVKKISLLNSKVDFQDKFNALDTTTRLRKINLSLKNLNSKKGTWADSKFSMSINKTGKLAIKSKIRQTPLKIKSKFDLKKLDLSEFQPYVDKKANMDLNSGMFNLDFDVTHDEKNTKLIANTEITDLNLSERREGKTFFAFSKLVVKSINLELNPNQLKIEKIDIYNPYARMKIDANRTTNLDNLVIQDSNTTVQDSNTTVVSKDKNAFPVFIGKVNFKNGAGYFSDLSLPLPFKTDIHDLNGQMLGLGTIESIRTKTDISGVVDEYGLMTIKGELLSANPKKFTDIALKFQNIDMTNLSPYTGKFIGYKLKEGKMNVELDYKIKDSNMQGGNRIILKKLTLGEEVESEDAISAPVGLAIALLKDSDGVIDLDVPVTGDVDSPDFEISHVVWTAVTNIITGVATAPFRFLGNMLGISGDELENVAFEEGKSILLPPEREKLDKLYTALSSKEMLTLKVAGSYDKKRDLLAMQTASVYAEALVKLDDNTTDISKMDRDDLDNLIKELYVEHFTDDKLDALDDKIDKLEIDSDAKKIKFRKQMIAALTADQKVDVQDLVKLANTRASVVVEYLITKGIQADRLGISEPTSIETIKEEDEYIPSKLELGAR